MELETALETLLESSVYSPTDKIEGIQNLIKGRKEDEFIATVRAFLVTGKLNDDQRVKQIEYFVENRRSRDAKQQQLDVVNRKLKNEASRPWGTKRARVDDQWDAPPRTADDECRCDACGVRANCCCLFPKSLRPSIANGVQWIFTGGVVILVLRYFWYSAGRAF